MYNNSHNSRRTFEWFHISP